MLLARVVMFLGLVVMSACEDAPGPTVVAGLDEATATRLFERLDRLTAALERVPLTHTPIAAATVEPTARSPAVPDASDLAARVAALEQTIATLRAQPRPMQHVVGSSGPLPPQTRAIDGAIRLLASEDKADRLEGQRSVFFLSMDQVLQRFGVPAETECQAGVVVWTYVLDGGERKRLKFWFYDGLVQSSDAS